MLKSYDLFNPANVRMDRVSVLKDVYELVACEKMQRLTFPEERRWNREQMSSYIESALFIPISIYPFIVVKEGGGSGNFKVLDGIGRIQTLIDFHDNRFALSELKFYPDLENKTFWELPRETQRRIEERPISVYEISINGRAPDSSLVIEDVVGRLKGIV